MGRGRLEQCNRHPPSLRSTVATFVLKPASQLRMITGICTGTRTLRRTLCIRRSCQGKGDPQVQEGNENDPTRVFQLKLPLLGRNSFV
jgi:hypothetical protein